MIREWEKVASVAGEGCAAVWERLSAARSIISTTSR
jgi:hypothetical protein